MTERDFDFKLLDFHMDTYGGGFGFWVDILYIECGDFYGSLFGATKAFGPWRIDFLFINGIRRLFND